MFRKFKLDWLQWFHIFDVFRVRLRRCGEEVRAKYLYSVDAQTWIRQQTITIVR